MSSSAGVNSSQDGQTRSAPSSVHDRQYPLVPFVRRSRTSRELKSAVSYRSLQDSQRSKSRQHELQYQSSPPSSWNIFSDQSSPSLQLRHATRSPSQDSQYWPSSSEISLIAMFTLVAGLIRFVYQAGSRIESIATIRFDHDPLTARCTGLHTAVDVWRDVVPVVRTQFTNTGSTEIISFRVPGRLQHGLERSGVAIDADVRLFSRPYDSPSVNLTGRQVPNPGQGEIALSPVRFYRVLVRPTIGKSVSPIHARRWRMFSRIDGPDILCRCADGKRGGTTAFPRTN